MRAPLLGDLVCAARGLLARPAARRPAHLRRLLAEARTAEAWRRERGRTHPLWGDGSLRAAAARHGLVPEPPLSDPSYRACLIAVLTALEASTAACDPAAPCARQGGQARGGCHDPAKRGDLRYRPGADRLGP